jgi:ATP-binding cassette, subfamily B, bacterial
MTSASLPALAPLPGLPLAEGEEMRAVFHPDLDGRLAYAGSLVALTSQRLCWQTASASWSSVGLGGALHLQRREHAGLGEIRITQGTKTVARFFHTLAVAKEATQFSDAFETLQGKRRARPLAPAEDQDSAELTTSGKFPLLRLLRFMRPHLGKVVLGFLLTLASTAAGLIPPYLTMPLVDGVLVPGQKEAKHDL